jgi:ribosomal protein L29
MKTKELQKLTVKELQGKHQEIQTQLIKERAQIARGTASKNPYIIKNSKKAIARILTILTTKEKIKERATEA